MFDQPRLSRRLGNKLLDALNAELNLATLHYRY
jgi:hypothetical protein